jgi:hypothetical protein
VVVAVPPEGPNRQPFPAVRPFKEEEEKRPGDEYVARLEMLQAIEEWAFPASLRRLFGQKGRRFGRCQPVRIIHATVLT